MKRKTLEKKVGKMRKEMRKRVQEKAKKLVVGLEKEDLARARVDLARARVDLARARMDLERVRMGQARDLAKALARALGKGALVTRIAAKGQARDLAKALARAQGKGALVTRTAAKGQGKVTKMGADQERSLEMGTADLGAARVKVARGLGWLWGWAWLREGGRTIQGRGRGRGRVAKEKENTSHRGTRYFKGCLAGTCILGCQFRVSNASHAVHTSKFVSLLLHKIYSWQLQLFNNLLERHGKLASSMFFQTIGNCKELVHLQVIRLHYIVLKIQLWQDIDFAKFVN